MTSSEDSSVNLNYDWSSTHGHLGKGCAEPGSTHLAANSLEVEEELRTMLTNAVSKVETVNDIFNTETSNCVYVKVCLD